VLKTSLALILIILVATPFAPTQAEESCAQIARNMGRCIAADLNNGRPCKDDTVLPERCRNTSDALSGMKQGFEDAEKARKRDEREYFERQ
jgi:hypothetical protein